MPVRAPSIRSCGCVVPHGMKCTHAQARYKERNAYHDQQRPTARQRGYDSKWDKTRAEYLHTHPSCAMCGNPAKVVDHIIPHRGDMKLFWSRSNWQPLCTPCHSGRKQSMEKRK